MVSFVSIHGCNGSEVFNQTKDVCKINFSEDKKDLENIPCLKLPISSQDFSSLSIKPLLNMQKKHFIDDKKLAMLTAFIMNLLAVRHVFIY